MKSYEQFVNEQSHQGSTILMRHARSKHNVQETTDLDSEITSFGRKQCMVVGNFARTSDEINLDGYTFVVSPFYRTLLTLDLFLKAAEIENPEVIVNPIVGENLNTGVKENENVRVIDRSKTFKDWNWDLYHEACDDGSYRQKPETHEQLLERMKDACGSFKGKTFVVSHAYPVIVMSSVLEGNHDDVPVWDYSINNCSLTWIENGKRKWYGRNLHHELED